MKIGILSSGGDCPGINATIRGVGKTAMVAHNMQVLGFHKGFSGILAGNYEVLDMDKLSGILHLGGTILGTSREGTVGKTLLQDEAFADEFRAAYHRLGLDAIVAIGGNGTMKTAKVVSGLGLNVVAIPKTIDNDVWGTDVTFGFDTAVSIATEAIDRLHSTAASHNRVMVVEVMGHHAGWIALHAGMAGAADVILLPELGFDIDVVKQDILERARAGKKHSIIVVAEGIEINGKKRPGHRLSKILSQETSLECRETVLGYVQRGGAPSATDRNLGTRMGGYAAQLIANGTFGVMVRMHAGAMGHIPLSEVAGRLKLVEPDNELIIQGRRLGISFGLPRD